MPHASEPAPEPPPTDQTATEGPPTPPRRRGPPATAWLVIMVVAIFLFVLLGIVLQLTGNTGTRYEAEVEIGPRIRADAADAVQVTFTVSNTGAQPGRPDICEAVLLDADGRRVGTAGVRLERGIEIRPGDTYDVQAVGAIARMPTRGIAECRSLRPG